MCCDTEEGPESNRETNNFLIHLRETSRHLLQKNVKKGAKQAFTRHSLHGASRVPGTEHCFSQGVTTLSAPRFPETWAVHARIADTYLNQSPRRADSAVLCEVFLSFTGVKYPHVGICSNIPSLNCRSSTSIRHCVARFSRTDA